MPELKRIGEHTIDVSILPERPRVLDVGCRDWGFCHGILALRPDAMITALDPDPKIEAPELPISFWHGALVGKERESARYIEAGGEANHLADVFGHHDEGGFEVRCITLNEFDVKHWDLVKLDCEGSEFEILENWPERSATQISVEFHDYCNWQKWDDAYFARLFAGPLKDYEVVQHNRFGIGPGNDQGFWDDLLVLRNP